MNSSYFKNSDTLVDPDTVSRVTIASVAKIRDSLIREQWLPLGLRSLVASEISLIDEHLDSEQLNVRVLAQQVQHFMNALDAYKEFHEKSEVIRLVKILFLLMQNFLESDRDEFCNTKFESDAGYCQFKEAM